MSTVAGFKRVARDVTDLCELQLQLLAVDGKVATRRGALAGLALGLALTISVSAITTLLLSAGWAVHEFFHWPVSGGLLLSAGVALVVVVVLVWIAYRALKQALGCLDETRSEMAQNLKWIKSMLSDDLPPGSAPAKSGPSPERFSRSANDRVF